MASWGIVPDWRGHEGSFFAALSSICMAFRVFRCQRALENHGVQLIREVIADLEKQPAYIQRDEGITICKHETR